MRIRLNIFTLKYDIVDDYTVLMAGFYTYEGAKFYLDNMNKTNIN